MLPFLEEETKKFAVSREREGVLGTALTVKVSFYFALSQPVDVLI
jgi:hypothetical protein